VVEALVGMAEEVGASMPAYTQAWALRHPAVTSIIVGPRLMHHLDAGIEALGVKIPDAHLKRIDELVAPGTCG